MQNNSKNKNRKNTDLSAMNPAELFIHLMQTFQRKINTVGKDLTKIQKFKDAIGHVMFEKLLPKFNLTDQEILVSLYNEWNDNIFSTKLYSPVTKKWNTWSAKNSKAIKEIHALRAKQMEEMQGNQLADMIGKISDKKVFEGLPATACQFSGDILMTKPVIDSLVTKISNNYDAWIYSIVAVAEERITTGLRTFFQNLQTAMEERKMTREVNRFQNNFRQTLLAA